MAHRFGEKFSLGGLAGVPFTGKTGWGAFSHHIKKGGNVFALYAPHIGVTFDGTLSKVHRPNQGEYLSSSCGASTGAFKAIGGNMNMTEEDGA